MDEEYDCVILGTGLTECILSGLLSCNGKKVLHIDRHDYYGGACASLTLDQVWKYFKEAGEPSPDLGAPRQYNVDLVPKFLLASGNLVKILIHTDVTRYLEFKVVNGSYIMASNSVYKIPANAQEALSTGLLGFFEKGRFKDFLTFCMEWKADDAKTHKGIAPSATTRQLMAKFKLDGGAADLAGHAIALYRDEDWWNASAKETIERIVLYYHSLSAYQQSPYLYPVYGLGDLPQSFARLSAIYGGTFMLNKPVEGFTFDENGRVNGFKSNDGVAKCKFIIGDPSYFPEKVKKVGEIVRCIAILDHPVPNTNNSESFQMIIPQNQVGRKNDIYISCVSFAHNVAPKGKYICIVSTMIETKDPKKELEPGLKLLGPTLKRFYRASPVYEPENDYKKDGIHISKSYDATSHFETIGDDVIRLYKEVTGETDVSYILKKKPNAEGEKAEQ